MESKIDEFKLFVKENPFLINYIKTKKRSWQDLYEVYDIYGDDEEYWNIYLNEEENNNTTDTKTTKPLEEIINMAKKVDVDKVQEGITSLQKALALFGDLFTSNNTNNKRNYNPRPLYRKFED